MSKPAAKAPSAISNERLARLLSPWLLCALAFVYFETAALSTRWGWSACRLAPVVGMFHGYPLYPDPATGVINGWLYGPVSAVAWAPAALAKSPQAALAIAACISLVFLLLPLFFAARQANADPGSRAPELLAFIAGAGGLLLVYSTWYMASALNADAVTVGLGAGACLILTGSELLTKKRLALAALLSVLAAWSKQVEAPLLVAQFAWLWFGHGRKSAFSFALFCTGFMALISTAFLVGAGASNLIFAMWTVPSTHVLTGGWTATLRELAAFGRYSTLFWLPMLVILLWGNFVRRKEIPPSRSKTDPVFLFIAAAVILLPTGIAATIKVGGDQNSIHSVYYLAVAATVAVARFWQLSTRKHTGLLRAAFLVGVIAVVVASVRQVASYAQRPWLPPHCLSQQDWKLARANPGQVYFPWDPLATLLAEGKMYHFEYGIMDRLYAGIEPTQQQINAHLPPQLNFVVYPYADGQRIMLTRYFPEFTITEASQGWLIYHSDPQKQSN